MFKRTYISIITIALILTMVAAGTYAYFSKTIDGNLNTTTAKVDLDKTAGFPLAFSNLVPGIYSDMQYAKVKNTSTIAVDLFAGLKWLSSSAPCDLRDNLWVEIYYGDGVTLAWQGDVRGVFENWVKVANDLPAGGEAGYYIRVKLASTVGNTFQGCINNNTIFIHATQWEPGTPPSTAPGNYSIE